MTESADCSSELIELIGTLFDNSDQSDMCLLIDGQEVHLHKLVIFKQSEVFRDLFEKATDASDLYHHINNTNEHPECMQVFRNFLEFFYTGKIDLSTDTIVPIVFLAYKYKVLSLSVCCHTYIKRYLSNESPPPDIDVVAAWYVHTLLQASDFAWLRDLCFEMMKRTLYQLIASSTSWYKLSFDDVFQLVRNSDVLVKDEFSLYDAMETWLEHCYNDDSEQLSTSLQECIQYVRFPMMSPTQLAKVQVGYTFRFRYHPKLKIIFFCLYYF
ncbi:BTB/POZ domain-containing protein 17-like [Saccoglossus kowalevskii]